MLKYLSSAIVGIVALSSANISSASNLNEDNKDVLRYHLGQPADTHPFKLTGLSAPEGTHIWTTGEKSSCVVPTIIDGRQVKQVTFKNVGALASESHPQTLQISYAYFLGSNGQFIDYIGHELKDCTINLERVMEDQVELIFSTRNHCKPSVIDPTNLDPRSLAFSFRDVELLLYPEEPSSPPLATVTMPAPSYQYVHYVTQYRDWLEADRKAKASAQKELADNQVRAALIKKREEMVIELMAKNQVKADLAQEEYERFVREERERAYEAQAEEYNSASRYAYK